MASTIGPARDRSGLPGNLKAILLHPLSVALWGSGVEIGLYLAVRPDLDLAKFFVGGMILAVLLFTAYLLCVGWQEGGLIGAWYECRFPIGSIFTDPSGARLTTLWLLVVGGVLAAMVALRHPEVAGLVPDRRGTRIVHDALLPGDQ